MKSHSETDGRKSTIQEDSDSFEQEIKEVGEEFNAMMDHFNRRMRNMTWKIGGLYVPPTVMLLWLLLWPE